MNTNSVVDKDGFAAAMEYWANSKGTTPAIMHAFPHAGIMQGILEAYEKGKRGGEHDWVLSGDWTCCKKCGIVRRADGKNRSCPGIVKIGLRQNEGPQ